MHARVLVDAHVRHAPPGCATGNPVSPTKTDSHELKAVEEEGGGENKEGRMLMEIGVAGVIICNGITWGASTQAPAKAGPVGH